MELPIEISGTPKTPEIILDPEKGYILFNGRYILHEINDRTNFEKKVTKFGTGAKIDAPKEYLGKKVVVLVRKD